MANSSARLGRSARRIFESRLEYLGLGLRGGGEQMLMRRGRAAWSIAEELVALQESERALLWLAKSRRLYRHAAALEEAGTRDRLSVPEQRSRLVTARLAATLLGLDRWGEALIIAEELLSLPGDVREHPVRPMALWYRAVALEGQGRLSAAIDAAEEVVDCYSNADQEHVRTAVSDCLHRISVMASSTDPETTTREDALERLFSRFRADQDERIRLVAVEAGLQLGRLWANTERGDQARQVFEYINRTFASADSSALMSAAAQARARLEALT